MKITNPVTNPVIVIPNEYTDIAFSEGKENDDDEKESLLESSCYTYRWCFLADFIEDWK
jgi:hypothetical protein